MDYRWLQWSMYSCRSIIQWSKALALPLASPTDYSLPLSLTKYMTILATPERPITESGFSLTVYVYPQSLTHYRLTTDYSNTYKASTDNINVIVLGI